MRDLNLLNKYRDCSPEVVAHFKGTGDETCGAFFIPSPIDKAMMRVIASADGEWDHVSISRRTRCPNWPEMEFAKQLFFRDDEDAMQLHVPVQEHINFHPHCLHLWRPQKVEIPRPPAWMVGPAKRGVA